MKTFIDINSTQKKIDRNLILVLEADFGWDKAINKKEYFEKVAVSVIKKLNENSSLRNKIYIPEALAKRKGKITLATLVSAILGNNFIGGRKHIFQENDEDEKTPFEEIKNIFSLLRKHIPNYSTDVGSFFLSNKGLRILFRIIQIYERNKLKLNIDFNRESLIDDLRGIFNDELVKKLEDYYGEGGAAKAVIEIFSLLKKEKRRKYRNFKTNLKNI